MQPGIKYIDGEGFYQTGGKGEMASVKGTISITLLLIIICYCVLLVMSYISRSPFPFALSLFCTACFMVSGALRLVMIIYRPRRRGPRR